jgi:hypothetical protein
MTCTRRAISPASAIEYWKGMLHAMNHATQEEFLRQKDYVEALLTESAGQQ